MRTFLLTWNPDRFLWDNLKGGNRTVGSRGYPAWSVEQRNSLRETFGPSNSSRPTQRLIFRRPNQSFTISPTRDRPAIDPAQGPCSSSTAEQGSCTAPPPGQVVIPGHSRFRVTSTRLAISAKETEEPAGPAPNRSCTLTPKCGVSNDFSPKRRMQRTACTLRARRPEL